MKPEESSNSQGEMSLSQQWPVNIKPEKQTQQLPRDAAIQVIRLKIDSLYTNQNTPDVTKPSQSEKPAPLEIVNPYHRTHSEKPNTQTNDWKNYHTAWQTYYQKYYEGYYTHHLEKTKRTLESQNPAASSRTISTDEALIDMRQDLIRKVQQSAAKIRKSRHFIPIISGLIVVLLFAFLQYNRLIVSNVLAYVSPGNIDPQNIVVDPNAEIKVGPEPRLIIPKINVDVPVIYDIGNDYDSQMSAMSQGVAQFAIPGASSHPGQIGNTVIAGHSSNDLLDIGDYKFIFAQLEKLNVGDTIYANYLSVRYTYSVIKKEVVGPNDVSKLVYPTTKPILTLLTCTPVGTSINRLLVIAEQISPDTSTSTKVTTDNKETIKSIPGNTPTFLERLFGAK